MKAMARTRYGPPDVLQFMEVPKPVPTDDEMLIRIHAASVNPMDSFVLRGAPLIRALPGLRTPKHRVPGADIAGRVEEAGKNVKGFRAGDEVFGAKGAGAFAEYVCVTEDQVAMKQAASSFEDAAAVPVAGLTALQGLRDKGRIQPGQKVLIYGASGGVGTFAVQIAKALGGEVTAVCSTRNMEIARSLGAKHVIDYTREDFRKNRQRYDLILGVQAHHSIFDYRRALSPDGIYVVVVGGMFEVIQALLLAPLLSRISSKKTCLFIAKIRQKDLLFLKGLLETGKMVSVIDKRFSLQNTADAMRYLEERHAQGKVVISVSEGNQT